jgi:hypothetical protein
MQKPLTIHHRKPTSIGGKTEPRNVVLVPRKKHVAWHVLFSNFTPEKIAEEINRLYLDPEYKIVALKRDITAPD